MISRIKDSFGQGLNRLGWMDATTAGLARVKVAAIKDKIAFPSWLTSDAKLDQYYADFAVQEGSSSSGGDGSSTSNSRNRWFDDFIAGARFEGRRQYRKVGRKPDPDEWLMNPATVNAYYSRERNEMVFPMGILRRPFFHHELPAAVNFGGIGMVMARELTHGFDDQGSRYDAYGTLAAKSIWPPAVRAAFVERTTCLADQYGNYSLGGEKVNGNLTLGENIADSGGLSMAFRAFRAWEEASKGGAGADQIKATRLPWLNLTSAQLFFVSFAHTWCGAKRPEALHKSLLTDVHSPNRFRVIGSVANSPEFAEAFGCGKREERKHCTVW